MGANLSGAFLYGLSLSGIKNLQYAYLSKAIEEIIGDITLKLGVLKHGEAEKYWQKFSNEVIKSLPLDKETKEDSKIVVKSIMNHGHNGNIDNWGLVLKESGKFYVKANDVYLNLCSVP